MENALSLAAGNLLSPMVLFFALGMLAALVKSDLSVPEAVAKGMALYLMLAIGFKGGAAVSDHGLDVTLVLALIAGAVLSFLIPAIAYFLLRASTKLSAVDAAAVSAHYGSISIVTYVAASSALQSAGIADPGYMVAVAAVMESPAIISALYLLARSGEWDRNNGNGGGAKPGGFSTDLLREVVLNGSVVLLIGAFVVGLMTGQEGFAAIAPFIDAPFKGVLCLFLLDMGLVAGRGLRQGGSALGGGTVLFGLYMPLISAAIATPVALMIGLSPGGAALLITLAASASYIAVPAAMRLALPEAKPAIYLTLSLGVTFPFNLTIGIPLYIVLGQLVGAP